MKGYLILEDGERFEGEAFGDFHTAVGELVFTTGMTGYLETITDPSYCGQLVVQTFPLIGNAGVIPEDFESSRPALRGYIVREWCREPSNFRSGGTLDAFLQDAQIPALSGVDTREITRIVRERGVMNAALSPVPDIDLSALREYRVRGAVEQVGCREAESFGEPGARLHVVLLDFGAKEGIARELLRRGCRVTRVPPHTAAAAILALKPDGVALSNGPGDPADNEGMINEIQKLCESGVPLFGVCLGHQLLALARGAKTVKLRYGHRGANQPALETATGRVYITSQNHGYAVDADTLPPSAVLSWRNANDGTCEGIDYRDIPAFSVQFHPEASAGPRDASFLFDRLIERMEAASCR